MEQIKRIMRITSTATWGIEHFCVKKTLRPLPKQQAEGHLRILQDIVNSFWPVHF
jgi:hypothetical protein